MDHHHFKGNDIPHIKLDPDMSIEDLVKIYSESGFNGRKLGEAAKVYAKMIKEDATICLTASGALTPVGFGGIFKTLIERGFVDWIVTTGANVYHEDHFAWGLPVKQGDFQVDDMKLYDMEIVRIRDVFIKFYETLEAQDQVIQKAFKNNFVDKPFTTAEFCNFLGKISSENSKYPEKSFVTTAYNYDVPIYISTLKDSSLALNLAIHRLREKTYSTDARPDTGGLSGATLQEGKSWGKVQDAHHDMVTVYADATIAFPILALYVISNQKSRKPKRLYKKLNSYYDNLKNGFFQNAEKYYDK